MLIFVALCASGRRKSCQKYSQVCNPFRPTYISFLSRVTTTSSVEGVGAFEAAESLVALNLGCPPRRS